MFFMTESGNPFDYMSNLWTVFIVVVVVCGVLLVVLRPLHKYWTDRKTQEIINETGGPAPAVKPAADDDDSSQDDEESSKDGKESSKDDEDPDEDASKD